MRICFLLTGLLLAATPPARAQAPDALLLAAAPPAVAASPDTSRPEAPLAGSPSPAPLRAVLGDTSGTGRAVADTSGPETSAWGTVGGRGEMPARADSSRREGFGLYVPEADRRLHRRRLYTGLGLMGALDVGGLVALADLWYSDRPVPFHWYSDAPPSATIPDDGWLDDWHTYVQMDKGGHLLSSYHITRLVGEYGRWSGLSDRGSALLGAGASLFFQTQIEYFDGLDSTYGASRTDLLANVVGATVGALKVGYPRQTAWFDLKLSYSPSRYYDKTVSSVVPLRVLGNAVKDYEGLTYWLALRPSELGAPAWWPSWLGVAAGYGGKHLAHPVSGLFEPGHTGPNVHVRQYYLSLDLALLRHYREQIPAWLRPVTMFLELVRLPAPALELSSEGVHLHALHF